VDDALGQHLSQLMFDGPDTDLNMTENTQPALMAVSVAVARVLQEAKPDLLTAAHAKFVAGHSLGEYSALTAAGSFSLRDAARLLKLRGQSMQKAVPVGVGAMAAILGLDLPDVAAIAKEANSADEIVSVALATEKGAKRAVLLPVSAPFHCALMQPAADAMRDALANTTIHAPSLPLIANVLAAETVDPAQIRQLLVEQVTGMVRWRESVLYMKQHGVAETIELGAGKVLTGLTKRIDGEMTGRAVGTPKDIEDFVGSL
jgi:[acyl-carrier-protein] S-malonyltransferase